MPTRLCLTHTHLWWGILLFTFSGHPCNSSTNPRYISSLVFHVLNTYFSSPVIFFFPVLLHCHVQPRQPEGFGAAHGGRQGLWRVGGCYHTGQVPLSLNLSPADITDKVLKGRVTWGCVWQENRGCNWTYAFSPLKNCRNYSQFYAVLFRFCFFTFYTLNEM